MINIWNIQINAFTLHRLKHVNKTIMEKQKNDLYKWVDSMAAFFGSAGATLQECEDWAEKCIKDGWVRNGNILSHPNHGQVLYLIPSSQLRYYGEVAHLNEKMREAYIASQEGIIERATPVMLNEIAESAGQQPTNVTITAHRHSCVPKSEHAPIKLSLQEIAKIVENGKATPSPIANDSEFKIIDYVSLITNNPINNNNEK